MTMLTSRAESEGVSSEQGTAYSQPNYGNAAPSAPQPTAPAAASPSQDEDDLPF